MLLDLLWADPCEDADARGQYFALNPERQCSVYFGEKPVANILKREMLKGIVRAHQCVRLGYQKQRWRERCRPQESRPRGTWQSTRRLRQKDRP